MSEEVDEKLRLLAEQREALKQQIDTDTEALAAVERTLADMHTRQQGRIRSDDRIDNSSADEMQKLAEKRAKDRQV